MYKIVCLIALSLMLFTCSDPGTDYFASKMISGMSYVSTSKRVEKACTKFAEEVLPVFQKMLKEEQKSTL